MTPQETYLRTLTEESKRLIQGTIARNTVVGYRYDWTMFEAWCNRYALVPFPADPETVLLYLTDLIHQGKKLTTANRRKCAIAYEHRQRGADSPVSQEVKRMLSGAQRLKGEKPRQMLPITVGQLSAISGRLESRDKFTAWRDRALLVLGFASALRRSNLVALQLGDVEFCKEGLVLTIDREKNDQQGRGRKIGVPRGKHRLTCPVRTMRAWLKRRGETPGALFLRKRNGGEGPLDGDSVTRIVKTCVALIAIDSAGCGAHSLRAGFVTEAGLAEVPELQIAQQTDHRSMAVLRRYFRPQHLFRGNAGAMVGL